MVTGASSGIGLGVAQHLAREGVAVVLGARRADRLDDAVRGIRAAGGRADSIVMDVTSEASVQRLVQHAREAFGRLDVMICNAGFGFYGTVEETPGPTMQRMMDVNFMGTFYGARAALPIFRAQSSRSPDRHLVDRRPAWHRPDERVQRDESGAGRLRRIPAHGVQRAQASPPAWCCPSRPTRNSVRR